MPRKVLVLGGTDFVGPALVSAALAHGDDVTIFHRGQTGRAPDGVRVVHGDRTNPSDLDAVAGEQWDLVADAWSRAPRVVLESARKLESSAARYVYISTISVYEEVHEGVINETSPVVTAAPDAEATDYASDKRGAELAIESVFGPGRCVFARPGLIIGPRENIGRLPWWLRRIAAGGDVLAPGPQDNALQYIDARDLAAFSLDTELTGAVNVLSLPGFTTMSELLALCIEATGSDPTLTWVDAQFLLDRKVEPWTEVPIWVPPLGDMADFYKTDASLAHRSGLVCRPVRDTVFDTWSWLRENPDWTQIVTGNRARVGLDPGREEELLAAWADQPPAAL
jgi:2'-hydroxyisoflavone reductase